MSDLLKFHHLGLALNSNEDALCYLNSLGYRLSETIYDPEQNVNLQMAEHDSQPDIEIVLPGEGDGPLTPILKRYNELVYHICYETENLDDWLKYMNAQGIDYFEVSTPKPALLFGGELVSFYRVRGFGLIEVISPRGT